MLLFAWPMPLEAQRAMDGRGSRLVWVGLFIDACASECVCALADKCVYYWHIFLPFSILFLILSSSSLWTHSVRNLQKRLCVCKWKVNVCDSRTLRWNVVRCFPVGYWCIWMIASVLYFDTRRNCENAPNQHIDDDDRATEVFIYGRGLGWCRWQRKYVRCFYLDIFILRQPPHGV